MLPWGAWWAKKCVLTIREKSEKHHVNFDGIHQLHNTYTCHVNDETAACNSRRECLLMDMLLHRTSGNTQLCGYRVECARYSNADKIHTFRHGHFDARGRKEWCVLTPSFLNGFGPYTSTEVVEHVRVPTLILLKTYTCWDMSFSLCISVKCGEHISVRLSCLHALRLSSYGQIGAIICLLECHVNVVNVVLNERSQAE